MGIDWFAEVRIRTTRGQALFNEIKNAVLISASLKVILALNTLTAILLALVCLVGFYVAGSVDLDWFGLLQAEAKLSTSKYNPHLRDIAKVKQ